MNTIKPIETIYNGYRFRSRLEARWAVFFDRMGISYEYEKEGYQLENGEKYLPDFWLPDNNQFLEVKPTKFTKQERNKCVLLSKGTGFVVILADGIPDIKCYEQIYYHPKECKEAFGFISPWIMLWYHKGEVGNWETSGTEEDFYDGYGCAYACLMAKQARFEHGERG